MAAGAAKPRISGDGKVVFFQSGGALFAFQRETGAVVVVTRSRTGGVPATGELKAEGSSITEGIGQGRITKNIEGTPVDVAFQIPDSESIPLVYDLIRTEGLLLGGSSGVNVAGAVRMARALGPGHVIVTVLCDSGLRYRQRLFNRDFLAARGLFLPEWLKLEA